MTKKRTGAGTFKKGVSGNPKECRTCGEFRSLDMFYRNSNTADGLDGRCKPCESIRRKKSYFEDFDRETLNRIRHRSIKKGILFDLNIDDIPDVPKYCPILDIELKINWGGRAQAFNSPTLDKIDPNLGYVRGNIAWISAEANRLKQDNTRDTLLKLLRYLDEHA